MSVLGSAEVELTLDPGDAGSAAERELTSQLEAAGRKAGAKLEDALGDAGKRAGKAAGGDISTGLVDGAGDAGKRAGAKLEAGLVGAGRAAGRKAGEQAGEGVGDGVDQGTRGIGAKGVAVGAALGAGIAGAAEVALGSIGDLIGGALEQADLPGQLRAKLGTGAAESAELGKAAGAIYAANYGELLGEVTDALVLVRRSSALMASGASEDLQGVTASALVTAQTIGGDLNQVIETAGKLVQNGLAPNAKGAFDLLVTGAQRGTDASGDLLDTFSEYSPQFAKLGVQGPQALGLLDQAIRAGARNTDIAADAFKEFSIRAIDGSALTAQGFRGLGLDAGDMASKIAAGGKTANDALDLTLDRLRAIPDPVTRSQVAVALFGTQAEDLGAALFALDPSTAVEGLGQVAGAADAAGEALASGPKASLDAFLRSVEGKAVGVLGTLVGAFSDLPGPVRDAAGGLATAAAGVTLLSAGVGAVGPKIKAGREQLASYGPAGEKANAGLGKAARGVAALGGAFAVFAVASVALGKLQDALVDTPPAVNTLTSSLLAAKSASQVTQALSLDAEGLGAAIKEVVSPDTEAKLRKFFSAPFGESRVYREAKGNLDSIDAALAQLVTSGNADEAARQFKLITDAAAAGGASVDEVKRALPGYESALAGVANEATLNAGAQKGQAESTKAGTGAFDDQRTSAEKLSDALDTLSGAAVDNTRADIAVRDAKDALTQSLKDNGRSFDLNTPKGRENAAALLDARDAAARYAEAQEKLTPGVGRGTAAFKAYVAQLVEVLRKANVSEAAIAEFTRTVLEVPATAATEVSAPGAERATAGSAAAARAANSIPGAKSTAVSSPGAESAASKMSAAARAANGIPGAKATSVSAPGSASAASALANVAANARSIPTSKFVTVSVASRGVAAVQREINSITGRAVSITVGLIRGNGVQARMAGGPVVAGEPYLVGEAGPEIVVPSQSGTVIPNDKAFGSGTAVALGGGTVELGPATIRALAAALAGAPGGDVLLDRDRVGRGVSKYIGGTAYRNGVGR